jgi:uncharacterized protein DUF6444
MNEKDKIIAELKTQVQTLLKRIKELEEEIARLKKDSNNSSKPPSSDIVNPKRTVRNVSRKKRKRGGQFGHRKFPRQPFTPEEIDEAIEYELKDKDAAGLEPLEEWFVVQQVRRPPDHTLARKLKKRFKGNKADNYCYLQKTKPKCL